MRYLTKTRKMYSILTLLLIFFLCFCSPLTLYAKKATNTSTSNNPKETIKFLYDEGNLFTKEQKKTIKAKCKKVKNVYDINTVILTDSTMDEDPKTHVEDFYDENAVQLKDAVILYINMTSRGVRIDGFGACQYIFDEDTINSILDEITPQLANNACYTAAIKFLNNVNDFIVIDTSSSSNRTTTKSEANYSTQENNSNLSFGEKTLIALGISLLIGGIWVGVMVYNSSAKMTAAGSTYLDPKNARILAHWDHYLRTTTTRTPKPKDDSNSSSNFGGGGGVSSGGHSHSGGGRSF